MKDKGHFIISVIKSSVRIGAGFWAIAFLPDVVLALQTFIFGILLAELLGVAEEIIDRR